MAKSTYKGTFTSFILDKDSEIPIYKQIISGLRDAIMEGRLMPGERLPSTRTLAHDWGVSRNTVAHVFEALGGEGFLQSRIGDGTYITNIVSELEASGGIDLPPKKQRRGSSYPFRRLSQRGQRLMEQSLVSPPEKPIAFMPDVPDLRAFPLKTWLRLLNEVSGRLTGDMLAHAPSEGDRSLRKAIVHHLRTMRGVRCSVDQVVITTGSQQALDLVTRMLLDPGDPVWMEEPGYIGIRATLKASECQVMSIPVDKDGMTLSYGRSNMATPRMICISPARQYPLGATLSDKRRRDLLRFASKSGAWVLEDDYDSEMRYVGHIIPALQNGDISGRVLYMGTFSKTLLPSLRMGFLVVPEDLAREFAQARSVVDRHPPLVEQMVLAEFINRGFYATHLRQMRTLYKARQTAMMEMLAEVLNYVPPDYEQASGMHFCIRLKEGSDDVAVAKHLWQNGIVARPLSIYYAHKKAQPGLLMGFAAYTPEMIAEAGQKLSLIKHLISHER